MSLNHEFLLIRRTEYNNGNCGQLHHYPNAIKLHTDIIEYLEDTLAWFSCCLPHQRDNPLFAGLQLYSDTLITDDCAVAAGRIFGLWADLFACGPETLNLRGYMYVVDMDQDPPQEGYQRLSFNREETVNALRRLAGWCEQVATSGGELYVLSLGI